MKNNKWSTSKKLYLALSILLTVQAIPFVGMFINAVFGMAIAGIAVSIILLVTSTKDNMSKAGALLGLITFSMAIISGMFLWALDGSLSESVIALIFIWMFINWCVCMGAVIVSYITTFSKKRNQADYVGGSSFPGTTHMKAPQATETVKVGFGGEVSLSEVKFQHATASNPEVIKTIKPVEVVTTPPHIPVIQKVEAVETTIKVTPTETVAPTVKKEEKYVTQVMGNDLNKILNEQKEAKKEIPVVSADKL